MSKLLFLSYSHRDGQESYLRRFVQELTGEVLPRLRSITRDDILFFDDVDIRTGDDWRKRIGPALASCKILVPICSPAFVDSESCGKELAIFLRRLERWEKSAAAASGADRPLIPILWMIEEPLPAVLERFQYRDSTLPKVYAEKGLRRMYYLGGNYLAKRRQTIDALATRIAEVMRKVDLPPLTDVPDFDRIESVIHSGERGPTRHGVAVLPILSSPLDTPLFDGEETLAEIMKKVSGPRPWRVIGHPRALGEEEILIVLVDPAASNHPLYSIARRELSPYSAVFVYGDHFEDSGVEPIFVQSSHLFASKLAATIVELRNRLIERDPPRRAEHAGLAASAQAEGIHAHAQPSLCGPTGGAP